MSRQGSTAAGGGLLDELGHDGRLRHVDRVAGGASATVALARSDMTRCWAAESFGRGW